MTPFDDDLDTWTLAAVRAGPTSFDDLLCHLPGVYPTDAHASLNRLLATSGIDEPEWHRAVRRQRCPPAPPSRSTLPVPHPLDFDWRFAGEAVEALVAACDRLAGPTVDVVCTGAPSLHERLLTDGRRSTLIDANPDVSAAMAALGADHVIHARVGNDALPELAAPVVVIDPPWYPEHVRLFLWAASRLCIEDGCVLLSFPPAGTRPGIAVEREDALAYAAEIGLVLEEVRRSELAYRSPPFERLALIAAGYPDLPEDWRRGDLLVFRASPNRPTVQQPPPVTDDARWMSLPVAPSRIKVRQSGSRPADAPVAPRLCSIVRGDVLPTVSRREPRRAQASVWTACNRVFACADTVAFAGITDARTTGGDPRDAVADAVGRQLARDETREVQMALEQLEELVTLEAHDLEGCGWHTSGS